MISVGTSHVFTTNVVLCVCCCSSMRATRLSERERVKIITYRYDFHYSQSKIARLLKCSQATISKVLKKHKHHKDLPQFHLSGQKKKLSPSQENHLKNVIRENNNLTSEEIRRHLFYHDSIDISSRSIRRYRRKSFHSDRKSVV